MPFLVQQGLNIIFFVLCFSQLVKVTVSHQVSWELIDSMNTIINSTQYNPALSMNKQLGINAAYLNLTLFKIALKVRVTTN